MADIQVSKQGKVKQAQKRLKKRLTQLAGADQLTAGQRDVLFVQVLQDLTRIELYRLGHVEDID